MKMQDVYWTSKNSSLSINGLSLHALFVDSLGCSDHLQSPVVWV